MTTDLQFIDFIDDVYIVPAKNVSKVFVDQGRVWAVIKRDPAQYSQIEVKNIETVVDWAETTGKLENLDEE